MSIEVESMWDAMKDVHYKRVIGQLEKSIRSTKKLEEALTVSLDMVVNAIHAVAGTFWFYDQFGDGRIRPKAVYGGGDLGDFSLLPGEGIAGEVIQNGKSVIIADCQKDPRWAGRADEKTGFRTETMICVPLSLKNVVFGSIQIINKTDRLPFDARDLAFAEHLANATADLFRTQGLLDDYLTEIEKGEEPDKPEISFLKVFGAPNDREMEYQIRRIGEFAALRVSEQTEVLRLCREIRRLFARSEQVQMQQRKQEAKKGFFRR